eukprot:jgi/Bigna1/76613/fgenesh1_pg.42_\
MASQLVPIAPQPILLKIIRRMVKEPTNGKLRRLKMEKLRGKLNTASILALKNHGFKEENGLLCLPLGSEGDKKAQNLLTMLESLRNKAKMFQSDQDEKRVISDSKDTINAHAPMNERIRRVASDTRENMPTLNSHYSVRRVRAVDPSQPPPSMWDSHVSAWRSAGKVLVDTLEAALKSPLARINCCPGALLVLRSCGFIFTANSVFLSENAGASKMDKLRTRACIVEIRRKLLKDSHQTAKARASAIDRLAFSALKKKKKKKQQQQQQQQQKRGPGADVSAEDYKSNQALGMRQRLKEATIRIDTLQALLTEKRDEFGEPFRIQWTVPNWKLRGFSRASLASHIHAVLRESVVAIAYVVAGYIRKPHGTGSRGRNDYGVGIFLECMSRSKLPAKDMRFASQTKSNRATPVFLMPSDVWGPPSHPVAFSPARTPSGDFPSDGNNQIYTFTARTCYVSEGSVTLSKMNQVIPGGGSALLSGLGAYDPQGDALCVRIDFAVSGVPVEPEGGEESDEKEGTGSKQQVEDDEGRIDDEEAGSNTKIGTCNDLDGDKKS